MGDDVNIRMAELETLRDELNAIVTEFEEAVQRSEALEDAIGSPFGRSELRERVEDFEHRWDDKRSELKESLDQIRKRVADTIKAFQDFDEDAALSLSGNE